MLDEEESPAAIDADRLRALVSESGFSARAVSIAAFGHPDGVRFVYIGKQKSTSPGRLRRLAAILRCSPEYLTGLSGERGVPDLRLPSDYVAKRARAYKEHMLSEPVSAEELSAIRLKPNKSKDLQGSGLIHIPEYDVRLSAGGGSIVETEQVRRFWSLPESYIQALGVGQRLAFVEIVGDSMAPTLLSGDLVLLDLESTNPTTPAIYALYDGGATVCKRVERILRSDPPALRLISDNPVYQTYEVPAEWANIIGRVAWCARKM